VRLDILRDGRELTLEAVSIERPQRLSRTE